MNRTDRGSAGRRASARPWLAATAGLLALACAFGGTTTAADAAPAKPPAPVAPAFGPHVTVFDPSMPTSDIASAMDAVYAKQVDDEMGTGRYAFLFKPGTYGTAEAPLQVKVGYNTEVAGLGASPTDVTINGKVEVFNRCLGDGGTSNCIALNNFWRSLSNLTIAVNGTGQDGCRASANFWAVSQAVSLRRVNVTGGNLSLMDYCTAGPQYASGGFIADSNLPTVISGSQQQWITRNSVVASWSNAVWNQVFAGVEGAPSEADFPQTPYTTLTRTPVSREKPYLYLDARGDYQVRVPAAASESTGTTWASGRTPGRSVPLKDFFIAKPGDSVAEINSQLARGRNLLLTPGVYDIARSIDVRRPDTVVLGLGEPTLTAVRGAVPVVVADVPGVIVAGLTVDAGTTRSPALMRIGSRHADGHRSGWKATSAANPTTLADVYFRVGGPHVGRTKLGLEVNSDHVLIDDVWVWRADHGVEGFTAGENGDTDRWNTNKGRTGMVVNGDDVTATGLFVEHFQQHNLVWNGERGRTVMFQSELAYDAPTQADWTQPDGTLGWASYVVSPHVRKHNLYGGGAYVFNQNNPSIHTANGFAVPERAGVRLHHVLTVNLGAGVIDHVVNGIGDAVDTTRVGQPSYLVDFPTP